ncbi:sensor histidine kinase [Arthrobacter bambusae]|uniref:sensor histidine kinase n=1 Tax=Arthrobacter bambusae TaxID=1338426 RepID=UPI002783AADD|nr:sensor histidine kinase [Arthrobacter bambusae]MDQ0029624.1 signal transduction histidine kinase [Arthrobacter bambusae]MDQ0097284.1 signal transduction histidine kinase [Arthrobacter bambusae]
MKRPIEWDAKSGRVMFFQHAFHEYSLKDRVALSQLPLTVTVCLTAILVGLYFPATLGNPLFAIFVATQAAAWVLCYAVPWDRLPFPAFLAIPLLDIISIGLGREGGQDSPLGISLLTVFPVIWLCASGLYRRSALAVSFLGPLAMIWTPQFIHGTYTPQDLLRGLLLPIMMLGIGASISVMTQSMVAQQKRLEERDAALLRALADSQQKERLLNTVLETVHLGVVAIDAEGREMMANRKQRENQVLATPGETDHHGGPQLLVFDADRVTPTAADRRPMRRAALGQEFTDYLVWVGTAGEQRALSTSARSMHDDDGNYLGSVIVFGDVTALVDALAAKDDFVSNVSHEFRTPLTSITGYVDLMLEEAENLPSWVVQQLGIVQRNADRLLSLVSDLLAVRAGHLIVQPHAVDVCELVKSSVASAGPKADDGGVRLHVDVPGRLEAHVDANRISQVLDNLISNAIKYSPDGGDVHVTLLREENAVMCRVKDTGMGMGKQDQADAFTRYFRAGNVRNTGIQGVGLGLSICKAIVDAHGGTIDLQSVPGEGTTFTFRVPA